MLGTPSFKYEITASRSARLLNNWSTELNLCDFYYRVSRVVSTRLFRRRFGWTVFLEIGKTVSSQSTKCAIIKPFSADPVCKTEVLFGILLKTVG